jgi:hypothetical protein
MDTSPSGAYIRNMDLAKKIGRSERPRDIGAGPARRSYWTLVHPLLLLVVSWITAAAVFLSGTEMRELFASGTSILKLLAGTALLYIVGIYFTQRLAGRRSQVEAWMVYERNAIELASMRQALNAQIARDSGASTHNQRLEN